MLSPLVALFSILSVGLFYLAASDSAFRLSPQGCRMSYMSPSYILQSQFPTKHAKRYSLLLYREEGWELDTTRGVPVLFIPGHAGSAHQIRSIASSVARQYYTSPYVSSTEFTSRDIKPLDFYAVKHNEDLSAFHGPTLHAEKDYATHAISHILSLYPRGTSIVVIGHSMGGVVATSLLPSPNISAVITLSTPHKIPPARFDRRIAAFYDNNQAALATANTPIISLCGGAADLMIPSESCILPEVVNEHIYRRTVFSSALEGCWTGVGHQVIVWCHQLRWRVARAALELGVASSPEERGSVLDRWLRDRYSLSFAPEYPAPLDLSQGYDVLPPGPFVLRDLRKPKAIYLARVPEVNHLTTFVAYVSGGSVLSVGPHHPSSLSVAFYLCSSPTDDPYHPSSRPVCEEWQPSTLKLIPNTSPGKPFPVPHEGADESEGVVVFTAALPPKHSDQHRWVAITYSTSEERGWILGGFVKDDPVVKKLTVHDLLYKDISIALNPNSMLSRVHLPSLLSNVLLVYRVSATYVQGQSCAEPLLLPLLEHESSSETHFHPLTHPRPLLLHTHTGAPFISSSHTRGVNLTLYTSLDCQVASLRLHVDWWGSLGRTGARYWTAVPGWAVGIVMWLMFTAVSMYERGAPMPSVSETLSHFTRETLPRFLCVSFVVSLLPLPKDYLLGNRGEVFFAFLTPVTLFLATGLVTVSWWAIRIILLLIRKLGPNLARRKDRIEASRNTTLSMVLIWLLVAVIIPWQVAFLGCWVIHLVTCATYDAPAPAPGDVPTPPARGSPAPPPASRHHADHLLLLLTWLQPLTAPVLAVWGRTLATAGPTALSSVGRGDHNFLLVAPYLILVDYASWTRDPLLPRDRRLEFVSARWCLLPPVAVAVLRGARHTYEVFDWVWVAVSILVALRVLPRYWGRPLWSRELKSRT